MTRRMIDRLRKFFSKINIDDEVPGNSKELFKFSWTVENVALWNSISPISSPSFMVQKLGNAAFFLELYVNDRREYCSVGMLRDVYDEAPKKVKLKFRLRTPTKVATFFTDGIVFDKCNSYENSDLIEKREYFKLDDWFLSTGDLKIECTIFEADVKLKNGKSKANIAKPGASKNENRLVEQCFALTRMKSEEISVKWDIEHFSKLTSGEKVTTEVFSDDDSVCFLVTLSISAGMEVENVEMIIERSKTPRYYPCLLVSCKASFDDINGIRVVKTGKHLYSGNEKSIIWNFPVLAKRRQLIREKSSFLPEDILSLLLEFKVYDNTQISEIEKTVYRSISRSPKFSVQELTPLQEKSLKMFREQQTCDVRFETSTKTIGAHEDILVANSPVFKAMFSHETLEKRTRTIRVTDISFETLERFLVYLYAKLLEGELNHQLTMELYFAADKYQVESLKGECSQSLKENLKVGNVFDVLTLADRHQDRDLRNSVRLFTKRNRINVQRSEEFKELYDANLELAAEVLLWMIGNR